MSSQAEKIKAFKHSQYSKLRKEEEEGWISGEELYTEGSSDEEIVQKSILKNKRKENIAKVSPLAIPNKIDLSKSEKIIPRVKFCDTVCDNSEEAMKDIVHRPLRKTLSETTSAVEWRPKRGSLQLQPFLEEIHTSNNKNTELDKIIKQFESLKESIHNIKKDIEPDYSEEEWNSSYNTENDEETNKLIKKICKLNNRLMVKELLFQEMKEERFELQQEICEDILNSKKIGKTEQDFLNCCYAELSDYVQGNAQGSEEDAEEQEASSKQAKVKTNKKFLLRNIELAKQGSMAVYSLTDEEKAKLENLLQESDDEEYAIMNRSPATRTNRITEKTPDDSVDESSSAQIKENLFKLTKEDEIRMKELEEKINKLLGACPEKLKRVDPSIVTDSDIEDADKGNKLWKLSRFEDRIKDIDKQLKVLGIGAEESGADKKEKECDEVPVKDNEKRSV